MKKVLAVLMLLVFATSSAFAANDGLGLTKKARKHKKEKPAAAQAAHVDKKAAIASKDLAKQGKDLTTPPGMPQAGK